MRFQRSPNGSKGDIGDRSKWYILSPIHVLDGIGDKKYTCLPCLLSPVTPVHGGNYFQWKLFPLVYAANRSRE